MKASLKGRYEYDTSKIYDKGSATSTIAFNVGDVKLRASMTEATFINGPSFEGVGLGIEKPGSFSIDYDVPKKDFKFQYMNTIRVAEKPLNMTYIHNRNDKETKVKGTLVLNSANKVSVNHKLGTENTEFMYTYVHRGLTTIVPCYDLAEDSWDFSVSQKVYGNDVLKASYKTSKQILGLEWSRNSKLTGKFKMSASVNFTEEPKKPKFFAETTWDFDHISFAN